MSPPPQQKDTSRPSTPPVVAQQPKKTPLPILLAGDVACGMTAAFGLTPFVSMIDKAIVQYASGVMTLPQSLAIGAKDLVTRPLTFIRRPEFLVVYCVYSATYVAANTIGTVCERYDFNDAVPKFIGVSCTNIFAGIYKDMFLAQRFGSGPARSMPISSFACFGFRDSMTIGASFTIPARVSDWLQRTQNLSKSTADQTAQIFCPVIVQTITTPVHLLGLGFYNSPGQSWGFHAQRVSQTYSSAVTGRMMRIAPAFGFGGIGNKYFRENFRASVTNSNNTPFLEKMPATISAISRTR